MKVLILHNLPTLAPDDPDAASEAGVMESVEAAEAALLRRGHQVRRLALEADVAAAVRAIGAIGRPDVIFNLFEGFAGVGRGEAEIAGLVELLGHRMTGSPADCLELVRNKARAKWLLAGAGLPTAEFCMIGVEEAIDYSDVDAKCRALLEQGPVIVKPAHEDASLGISEASIVHDAASLKRQIRAMRARFGAVLVERFLIGREFNVAVLALPTPEALPLAEIEFTGAGPRGWQIVTYAAKWDAGSAADLATMPRCPAEVDDQLAHDIRRVALAAFTITGCRHYARVDIRTDEEGRPHILEVNGNPDIGPHAGFARALAAAGIAYDEFLERLVTVAAGE